MFVLSKLKSMVRIDPKHFNRGLPEAISDSLNAKLANKVSQQHKQRGDLCQLSAGGLEQETEQKLTNSDQHIH